MRRETDTQPDLIAESTTVTMLVWSLEQRVKLPPQFANPELCIITFPGETSMCKISQLATPDREVDLEFACLNASKLTASFYDHNGELRAPEPDEMRSIREIERAVTDIIHSLGSYGARA